MACVFATHLDGIEEHLQRRATGHPPLPPLRHLERKCLGVLEESTSGDGSPKLTMTYQLMDGVCGHSFALSVAKRWAAIVTRGAREAASARQPRGGAGTIPNSAVETRWGIDATDRDEGVEDDVLFDRAAAVLREMSGADAGRLLRVDSGWQQRASAQACVYLLRLDATTRGRARTDSTFAPAAAADGAATSAVEAVGRRLKGTVGDIAECWCVLVEVASKSKHFGTRPSAARRQRARVRNVAKA